jgi:hypothetical protein
MRFPHCDARVLHAPEDGCIICNTYAVYLQQARRVWGINFTGHYDTDKYKCPSEALRPLDTINQWGGNRIISKT